VLSQVVELIEKNQNFGITTHVRPDGDGIGSSLALCWLLRSLGKKAEIIVRDDIPTAYFELPGAGEIRRVSAIDRSYDAVFVIECSDLDRPGIKGLAEVFTVNIDHHATSENFGTLNWIDATASAVGEMIYNLCKAVGGKITSEIAQGVYLALVTDTGSFHFSNTTERTLKIASELVRFGVEPARISEIVYNSYPWSRVELMRQVLGTVCRDRTGRVAWMKHTLEMDRIAGTRDGDNSGLVNYPLQAKEIVAAAYIREVGAGDYRVSVRSKGDIDVAIIAEAFGGGGHKNAAGFGIQGKLDEIECLIVGALIDSVNGLDIEAEGSLKRIELSAA